jgi:hypothetical protein
MPEGILEIVSDDAEEAGIRAPDEPPILRVRESQLEHYAKALEWLQSCNAFGAFADVDKDAGDAAITAGIVAA